MTRLKRVLLIAFHFPPVQGSSGVQRTLRFAQHLPNFGWQPTVLTIDPRAYESVAGATGNEVPAQLQVHRAFGVDAARTLGIFGRYPRWLALPDRWASWHFWAVKRALRIARTAPIDALWSTFPIATAHRIALTVAQRTGLPWVAEFRDPMWQHDYPPDPRVNLCWQELEKEIFARADGVVFTAPSAISAYRERFPQFSRSAITLIENGYDEAIFQRACSELCAPRTSSNADGPNRPLKLLHSGVIYPSERDPTHLFAAISSLKRRRDVSSESLQIVLRASGFENHYRTRLAELGIADIVRLEPPIGYLAAVQEMLNADGLLILQAGNCNAQVPAKLYEYLRAGRPILALTDPAGDTARALQSAETGYIARLDSEPEIESALLRFTKEIRADTWRRSSPSVVASLSREVQTGKLAECLNAGLEQRAEANARNACR